MSAPRVFHGIYEREREFRLLFVSDGVNPLWFGFSRAHSFLSSRQSAVSALRYSISSGTKARGSWIRKARDSVRKNVRLFFASLPS